MKLVFENNGTVTGYGVDQDQFEVDRWGDWNSDGFTIKGKWTKSKIEFDKKYNGDNVITLYKGTIRWETNNSMKEIFGTWSHGGESDNFVMRCKYILHFQPASATVFSSIEYKNVDVE